jgi:hypothetical protein
MTTLRDLAGYGGGFDAAQFIQLDQAGQRQRTLSELGQQASQGDLTGAERTAWAGGQTDIAAQLRGMNQADHERLVQDTASFALSADTPGPRRVECGWDESRSSPPSASRGP